MKKIAILQSNYIPWKGYFDFINSVDIFVIYDVVQYTKNDWRNRNKIILNGKPSWLTVPVYQKSLDQKIEDTEVSNMGWSKKHWRTLEQNYCKTKGFKLYRDDFKQAYNEVSNEKSLSEINIKLIRLICDLMNIQTKIISASQFELPEDRVQKILYICKSLCADCYVSGPAAKIYLDPEVLEENGIKCEWFDYFGYPPYDQSSIEFEHSVSILDLLFNEGENFKKFMKSF